MRSARLLFFLSTFLFLPPPLSAEEGSLPFDHSNWDRFLKKFGSEKGEVNYQNAQKFPQNLDAYLRKLKKIPAEGFLTWPREEKMAVLINAYNAGVVKLILDHYPVKSIGDISGVWDQRAIAIGTNQKGEAQRYSLNQIQNQSLRGGFRDEKVLFVLCSGAKGSPRLRPEAYKGPQLEGQIYLATREFVNDDTKNQIDPAGKKVILSRLFKWYGDDFLLNWGRFPEEEKWKPEEMAVLSLLAHYLQDSKKVEFLKEGSYKVKYASFDWSLNDWKKKAPKKTNP